MGRTYTVITILFTLFMRTLSHAESSPERHLFLFEGTGGYQPALAHLLQKYQVNIYQVMELAEKSKDESTPQAQQLEISRDIRSYLSEFSVSSASILSSVYGRHRHALDEKSFRLHYFSRYQVKQALQRLAQIHTDNSQIYIMGFSAGSYGAYQFSRTLLQKGIAIEKMITLDFVAKGFQMLPSIGKGTPKPFVVDPSIPWSNVKWINIYQQEDEGCFMNFIPIQGRAVNVAENIKLTLGLDPKHAHPLLLDDPRAQRIILDALQN